MNDKQKAKAQDKRVRNAINRAARAGAPVFLRPSDLPRFNEIRAEMIRRPRAADRHFA